MTVKSKLGQSMSPSERYEAKAIPFFNLPIILETGLLPCLTLQVHDSSLTFIGELASSRHFCKNNTSGYKENHFYSLPFGQAEASIY